MPSTVWKGSLSFGLVNIPVALHTATSDRTIRFHQLERGTADRIRNKRVNERTGAEVDYADVVKGYDLGGGEYVVVTQDELDAASPEHTRSVDIVGFVDLVEIDPVFYRSAYYLAPDGDPAIRAYGLLREVMHDAEKVAVASLVLRNKEHLVTVRARADVLVLETMYFADEIRDPKSEIPNLPADLDFSEREHETARMLLDSMTKAWEPEEYHDTYRARVEEIVEAKARGETVVAEAPAERAPVIDLVQALQASIDRAEGRLAAGDGAAGGGGSGARRASGGRTTKASKSKPKATKARAKGAKAPAKAAKTAAKKADAKKVTPAARRRAS